MAIWRASYPADQLLILVSETTWESRDYSDVATLLDIDLSSVATGVSSELGRWQVVLRDHQVSYVDHGRTAQGKGAARALARC